MAKTLDKPSLYDTDYVAWLDEQVAICAPGACPLWMSRTSPRSWKA